MWLSNFCHIVLHDESISDHFNVNGHRAAIVSGCCTGGDVGGGTTLVLRVGKMENPVSDIYLSIGAWIVAVTVERERV